MQSLHRHAKNYCTFGELGVKFNHRWSFGFGMILRKFELLTFVLILCCYGAWFGIGMLWQTPFWFVCIALPVLAAFHSSLQHETIHGHPTKSAALNELLVSLPLAVVFPYRRYRDLHLKHHNDIHLTDPYEDPESYFWPEANVRNKPKFWKVVFAVNNTFVGRLLIGPLLSIIGFGRTEVQRVVANEPGIRLAWALHIPGLIVVLAIVSYVFQMPLWIYFLGVVYPSLSIIAMRSYAEHQAAENVGARTAIVETNPVVGLLYLNNNLHIVHHANPQLAWYDLPNLYQERKQQFLAANDHTLFRGYLDIANRFAFAVKQPVQHPYMYTDGSKEGAVNNAE